MRKRMNWPMGVVAAVAIALLSIVMSTNVTGAIGGRPHSTSLTGAAEVPGPGDPDGSGSASVELNLGQGTVCYELAVDEIAPATLAHIHRAPAGVSGPPVVTLAAPTTGTSSGCVEVSTQLIKEILLNPEGFYVNVHNAEYSAGALRGQLSRQP